MQSVTSTFHIHREDVAVDTVTLITEGLLIGRAGTCDVRLNHPSVSRSHAGIQRFDGDFYVFGLSPTNATTLNGKLVESPQVLASGDTLQIGPFFVAVAREADALLLTVSLQIGLHIGELDIRAAEAKTQNSDLALFNTTDGVIATGETASQAPPVAEALEVFWQKRQREAGKIERMSPLRPRGEHRLGKSRYNWTPTTDLAPRRATGVFLWGVLIVAMLSIGAAYFYASAYSPAPVSDPHTRQSFALTPAVAGEPNANSCTSCHTLTRSMDASCASCHTTEVFTSNTMQAHTDAGINCTACHAEHRGEDFRPRLASLASCSECHNDQNKNLYNGKSVHTAHGGGFGYPVEDGRWTWEGVDDETWAKKYVTKNAALAASSGQDQTVVNPVAIARAQFAEADENERRSIQFHQIHLHRLRLAPGLTGNKDGEVSCSTCHKTSTPVDRETPRTTCAACHNGKRDVPTGAVLIADTTANCTSCHVQHRGDKRHWNPDLLADRSGIVMQSQTGAHGQSATERKINESNTDEQSTKEQRTTARLIKLTRAF